MTSRNWSTATLLSRLLGILADHTGVNAEDILDNPDELADMTAAELVDMLKTRVISDSMKGRI